LNYLQYGVKNFCVCLDPNKLTCCFQKKELLTIPSCHAGNGMFGKMHLAARGYDNLQSAVQTCGIMQLVLLQGDWKLSMVVATVVPLEV